MYKINSAKLNECYLKTDATTLRVIYTLAVVSQDQGWIIKSSRSCIRIKRCGLSRRALRDIDAGISALRSRSASWWSPGPIYRTISACRRCSRQSYTVLHNTTRRLHAAPSRRACHRPARLMTPYSNISLLNHTDAISYLLFVLSGSVSHKLSNQELRYAIQPMDILRPQYKILFFLSVYKILSQFL